MIWMLAVIVVVTIGVMAVIDAYFEGCSDSDEYIMSLYEEDMHKVDVDVDVWYNSHRLYLNSRY